MVRTEDVIWPLRALCHIVPFRYAVKAMAFEEFINSTFKGAERCNPRVDLGCKPEGYMCKSRACHGETGAEVLDSLHVIFSAISSEDETEMCILWLVIFCVTIKSLYLTRIAFIIKST